MAASRTHTKQATLRAAAMALLGASVDARAAAPVEIDSHLKLHSYSETDRMQVNSTTAWLLTPVGTAAAIEVSLVNETISGASPEYVSNQSGQPVQVLSSASIEESRQSGKLKASYYIGDQGVSIGAVSSNEDDYASNGVSVGYQKELKDRGLTLGIGIGKNDDKISSSRDASLRETRQTQEYMVGLTQILSRTSILQTSLVFTDGKGFFSDPYKYTISENAGVTSVYLDSRPAGHQQVVWLLAGRQHFAASRATLITGYRYYQDDWGVVAHTLELGWDQKIGSRYTVRPQLRYYTQRQADFYANEFPAQPRATDGSISTDHRLAGYGAIDFALRVAYEISPRVSFSGTAEHYVQKADLKLGPGGSSFDDLKATIFSLGVSAKF